MEKLTLTISPKDWGTLKTKYASDSQKVSAADFTEGTVNIDTDVTGNLTKRLGGQNYNPTLLPAAPKDQFEAIFSDGARHLLVAANGEIRYSSGDNVFNSIVNGTGFSAVANFEFATTQDRVYGGNGVNNPIVYDRNTSYGGVVYTAPRIKNMGVAAPGSAPTATVAAGGAVPVGGHTYKVTYLYYDSEESNGSPASNLATTSAGNQTVNLTSVPVGGYGVTARKIYRDNNDQLWLHVGTIANNTATTFSDTVAVGATPTEIPEFNNAPPTFSLIASWLDKLWLGKVPGDPYTLFYTETSMPDIVRPENELLCNQEDPITAYIVYFGRMIVFNRRSMGQILGTTPDTFRYSPIPSPIGCVDNRTLQIRVIEGVPILIWLSDRGFYSYDGNAINRISDEIEDLVNFNIQQAIQQRNSNTQSSQTQFQSGTSSPGIDLLSNPGAITTKGYLNGTSAPGTNPRRNWDDQTDWEGGSSLSSLTTKDGTNLLKPINFFNPSLASGTAVGLNVGSTLTLPTTTAFNGETGTQNGAISQGSIHGTGGVPATYNYAEQMAVPIIPARTGTITSISANLDMFNFNAGVRTLTTFAVRIETNAVTNQPSGSVVSGGTGTLASGVTGGTLRTSSTLSAVLTGGVKYWIVIKCNGSDFIAQWRAGNVLSGGQSLFQRSGTWEPVVGDYFDGSLHLDANFHTDVRMNYAFTYTPIPSSGTWTSPIYDTFSASVVGTATFGHNVTYTFPSGTTIQTIWEASDSPLFLSPVTVNTVTNTSSGSFALINKRYWRIRMNLTTTNNVSTPTTGNASLLFPFTSTWISEAIDTTADSTVYNSLTTQSTVPSGATVTTTIATSANNISYTSFVAFGSHVVQRYAKIRIVFTYTTVSGIPSVSQVGFTWTLVSNFISTGIDTAVTPPAGWDVFLSSFNTNGGTVVFQMRSATTLGGLTAATFFTILPGEFPTAVTPLQFVQWKVIITSADNDVPVIESVTVQWFITIINSIRPASIFTNSRYYVALAELNQANNNILLELDLNGKWRRHADLSISTFSFFFNLPYLGLAGSGRIVKFLEGLTDSGVAIQFDFRTKAFDYSTQYQNNSSKVKVVGEVILQGTNTGATLQVFYSTDLGETFIAMVTSEGSASYVTASDGQNFYKRFRPLWDGSNPISGRTIMYRVYSNDINAVEIASLETTAFLRQQAPVITG